MAQTTARERLERFALELRSGDIDRALELIDALIQEYPEQAPLHWHRARTLRALGRPAETLLEIQRVLALKPDYAQAWLLRAELALEGEGSNDPETDVRKAIELDPKLARAQLMLARLLNGGEQREAAAAALDRALELDPRLSEAYVERARLHRLGAMLGFGDEVPDGPDVIRTVSGQRWSRQGLEQTRVDLEQSLALKNNPKVRLQLANVLHYLGAHDAALAAFDAVLAVTPTDDPERAIIEDMRACSLDGGRGEREQMARLLEQGLLEVSAREKATLGHDMAASMIRSAAAGVRGGLSLDQSMSQFVSGDPDDVLAIDVAYKIHALAHEAEPCYVTTSIERYPRFMREHAESVTRILGAQGFRVIGDYEPEHLAEQLAGPTLVRIYAAADGVTCAASYRIEPKWPGWLAWAWLKLRGKWQRPAVVELETAFDDGGFLITNNAGSGSPFGYRGKVDLSALATEVTPAMLHSRHRERIERYRREHPHATALRLDTEDKIMAMQQRITEAKCQFRQSIGLVEENELRLLLGTHYERLAPRVREKLRQMAAAAG